MKLIQELNRSIILNMIREQGPISRSEIAKKNRLSPSTLTSAVLELIQEGLVCEDGIGLSNGGRKPIMLRFSPDNHFLIGISVTNTAITIAEINLEAKIRSKKVVAINNLFGETVISYVIEIIEEFLKNNLNNNKCIGISIIVPGIVDSANGLIRQNTKLKLKCIRLKEIIEERFKLKTWVENDVNAIVLAEKKFGTHKLYSNIIYITIGDGVGAGIIVNGSIFRGGRGGAGEFGHTSIDRVGIRCQCGNVGCLENYASWPAVYSRILYSSRTTEMLKLTEGDLSHITPSIFKEALIMGDPLAIEITEEIANYLSNGVVNLVNLFNPDLILFGGNLAQNNDLMLQRVNDYVKQHALTVSTENLKILSSSLGEDAELIGAASVLLQDVFHFSLSNEILS